MSDNWVESYIQDKKNKQRKTEMAVAGALGMFQKIQERIRYDLQIFHNEGMFLSVAAGDLSSDGKFRVSSYERSATLIMELSVILVQCSYRTEGQPASTLGSPTLKICSDLDGNLEVYEKGKLVGTESDLAKVSEFLLLPLLKLIEG